MCDYCERKHETDKNIGVNDRNYEKKQKRNFHPLFVISIARKWWLMKVINTKYSWKKSMNQSIRIM